jgi:hypothetical protein
MRSNTSVAGVRTSHSILNFRNLVEVFGIGQTEGAHAECMSRFLEVAFEIFSVTNQCQSSRLATQASYEGRLPPHIHMV